MRKKYKAENTGRFQALLYQQLVGLTDENTSGVSRLLITLWNKRICCPVSGKRNERESSKISKSELLLQNPTKKRLQYYICVSTYNLAQQWEAMSISIWIAGNAIHRCNPSLKDKGKLTPVKNEQSGSMAVHCLLKYVDSRILQSKITV